MRCLQCDCELSEDSVLLTFDSGRSWLMAERAMHYYACHRWSPPVELLEDVMCHRMIPYNPAIHSEHPTPIGFIKANEMYFQSSSEDGFFTKLWAITWLAAKINQRLVVADYKNRKTKIARVFNSIKQNLIAGLTKASTAMYMGFMFPRG